MITTRLLVRLSMALLTGPVGLAWANLPAFGADDFARGCQLYNSKDYAQAEPLLAATVRKFPKFWPAHYYLAHTYLAQNKKALAKAEYDAVSTCSPPPNADILASCQKVLAALGAGGGASGAGAAGSASAPETPGTAATGDSGEKDAKPPAMSSVERDKAQRLELLQKEMTEKVDALRNEQKQAIADADANSNRRYKYPDGTIKSEMSPEEKEALEQEYQQKIRQLQEDYKHRMSNIH